MLSKGKTGKVEKRCRSAPGSHRDPEKQLWKPNPDRGADHTVALQEEKTAVRRVSLQKEHEGAVESGWMRDFAAFQVASQ